jgi:hypothetical protein
MHLAGRNKKKYDQQTNRKRVQKLFHSAKLTDLSYLNFDNTLTILKYG